jgi:hypothetical protein
LHLLVITCRWCDFPFYFCRACWRGHAYCSDFCRKAGNLKNRREAQRRYRQTDKGKKQHREAENRRRYRQIVSNSKKMDDTPSTQLPVWCTTIIMWTRHLYFGLQIKPYCRSCGVLGQLVTEFPRRGYG